MGHVNQPSRQNYRTPARIFDPLHDFYSFTIDVASDSENAKCAIYIDEEMDAFKTPWRSADGENEAAWCNPPYEDIGKWIDRAIQQIYDDEGPDTIVMLLPASVGTQWFKRAWKCGKLFEVVLYNGRIAFDTPPGVENKKRPLGDSMLLVFDRFATEKPILSFRSGKTGLVIEDGVE